MKFIRFIVIVAIVSFSAPAVIFAQEKERVIKRTRWRTEFVELIQIKLKGKSRKIQEKFVDDDDWLRDLSVQVQNTSNQTIVYLEILIGFPQDENGMPKAPATETLRYGAYPSPLSERLNVKPSEPPLEPGDQTTLKLDSYDALQRLLDYAGHPASITEVTIRTGRVLLADGTMREGGQTFKRDPNDPGRWRAEPKPLSRSEQDNPLNSVLFNKVRLNLLPSAEPTISDCQFWVDTISKRCNNYACSSLYHVQGDLTGSPAVGFLFRESTERCYRWDNGQDCFAFANVWRQYFDCSSTAGVCDPECFEPYSDCPCYGNGNGFTENNKSFGVKPFRNVKASYSSSAKFLPQCMCSSSLIVIDVLGNGYAMTNAANGVSFDFNGDGTARGKLSWTAAGSDDAWLVLDRNSNDIIDNGRELFGNATPQPMPPDNEERQGFRALAEYDKSQNGGNNDGAINSQDTVFANLRLWQDTNHNGISEQSELKTLPALNIAKIELDYRESRRADEHGNRFRYRAKVWDTQGTQVGRWAWDVFLISQ